MKIAYYGECNGLSSGVLERLHKEEHDVYFLTSQSLVKEDKRFQQYHHYVLDGTQENFATVLASVVPDVMIYEGKSYLKETWSMEQSENMAFLSMLLEECVRVKHVKMLLLSSVDVYGEPEGKVTEELEPYPQTLKGRWLLQQENMVQLYQEQKGLQAVILRIAPVFTNEIKLGEEDYLGQIVEKLQNGSDISLKDKMVQPVHVSDVSDAILRVIDSGRTGIYNVSSSEVIEKSTIMRQVAELSNCSMIENVDTLENAKIYISNEKLKKDVEWIDFWSLKKMLSGGQITYVKTEKKEKKKEDKKTSIKVKVREILENMALFIFFGCLHVFTMDHRLFSQVDWLLVYVVIVALSYGVKQGTVAVVLACCTFLLSHGKNILEMTNFYSYVESVVMLVEYLFFGIVVGYTVDTIRVENRSIKKELENLFKTHEKLKEINDKNVMLKNEYEKRILETKTSLPRLYSIINRITVLDANRILTEVIHVIEELMQTNTVAVYRVSQNSSYLRLMVSLNKESSMGGNSWNIKEYPSIAEAINEKKLYQGNIWENEPAIVLPIVSADRCVAAIVIKHLPMETHSLYSINMLRTILVLASDSIDKAFQYDVAMREQKYFKDTNILIPSEFHSAVELAKEQKLNEMAESCIVKIHTSEGMIETYHKIERLFREMDIWGMDEKNNLFVLLGNTSEKDADIVLERLEKNGVTAEKVDDFR